MSGKIEISGENLIIEHLLIDDANIINIFNELPIESREEFASKALIIGSIGLRNLIVTKNVDYIEREFQKLMGQLGEQSQDIKQMISEVFNLDDNKSCTGRFRIMFEDYFDLKKGRINNLLDPYEINSPINKLKEEICQKIAELRGEIIKEKTTEEVESFTTKKGGKFEDIILEEVTRYCMPYEDKVEYVGNFPGTTGKTGDITIDVKNNSDKRIVVECKDSGSYSAKKTEEEIGEAINNREAKFGIFVFKTQMQVPSALQPVKIGSNYIITSFDDYGIYFAFRVARLILEKDEKKKEHEIPIVQIQTKLEDLKEKFTIFSNIERELTKVDNASSYVRENLQQLRQDVIKELEIIKGMLL